MSGSFALSLEPPWDTLKPGDTTNVQASLLVFDPLGKKHLFRSMLTQKLFIASGALANMPIYSFLKCSVVETAPRFRLDVSVGYALGHPIPTADVYNRCIEVCSGIGMMGEGIKSCGITINAANDLQAEFGIFQTQHGQSNFVEGDVRDPAVVASLHGTAGSSCMISGGFSCQPWSQLGDSRGTTDPRACSLVGILETSYWLRAHSILLECVCSAGQDVQVQQIIKQFCQCTGFAKSEITLELASVAPAKRQRWWCLLTNPTIPPIQLQPLPKMNPSPTVGDLFPCFPEWTQHELDQLTLDRYETNKFMEFGGLFESLVRSNEPLRTALHGWANQLTGCPCMCRKFPFSEERLKNKGIYGALIQLPGELKTYLGNLPVTRHLHPWEMALLHGCNPNRQWLPNLRFGIAALGQMAAPAQSTWIIAQLQSQMAAMDGIRIMPKSALWNQFQCVFAAAYMSKPEITATVPFRGYVDGLYKCLYESAQVRIGPGLSAMPSQQEEQSQKSAPHVPPTRFHAMPERSQYIPGPSHPENTKEAIVSKPGDVMCNLKVQQAPPMVAVAIPREVFQVPRAHSNALS